jgi:hypothetical protein
VTRDEFSREIQATQQYFEIRLAAVDARTRRTVNENVGTNAGQLNPPKSDGTTSWSILHRQFDSAVDNNDWTSCGKPCIC